MAGNTIELKSEKLDEMIAQGKRLGILVAGELKQAMEDTVLEVEKRAKERAPIDEGHLRRGIRGEVNVAGPMGLVGSVVAGGLAAAYAEVQHEREDFEHPKGGQDHFLYGKNSSAWSPNMRKKHQGRIDAILGKVGRKAFGG